MSELWEKALESAEDARLLFHARRYDGAVSRSYYAMFNAARSLLADRSGISLDAIKRHGTIARLFAEHFIRTGLFAPEFGRFLARASETRKAADYDDVRVELDAAREVLEAMERFMAVAESVRRSKPSAT